MSYEAAVPTDPSSPGALQVRVMETVSLAAATRFCTAAGGDVSGVGPGPVVDLPFPHPVRMISPRTQARGPKVRVMRAPPQRLLRMDDPRGVFQRPEDGGSPA